MRRIIAAGGHLGRIAGLDNFCWPDPVESTQTPDGQHKLAQLVRCCQRLAEMTIGLDLPGLQEHLRQTVANQIAIDQPRYSGLRQALVQA